MGPAHCVSLVVVVELDVSINMLADQHDIKPATR